MHLAIAILSMLAYQISFSKPSASNRKIILQEGCQDHCLTSYASNDFVCFSPCKTCLGIRKSISNAIKRNQWFFRLDVFTRTRYTIEIFLCHSISNVSILWMNTLCSTIWEWFHDTNIYLSIIWSSLHLKVFRFFYILINA